MLVVMRSKCFCLSSKRRHTRCPLVTGVQTCALPIYPGTIVRKRGLKGYLAIPSLARYVIRRAPDIVLSAASHANIPAILAWHLAGKPAPLVLRASNHPSGNLQHRPRRYRLFKPLYNRLGGLLYARADAIIAVSRGVAAAVAELTGLPSERISTIYNPMVGGAGPAGQAEPPPHPWLVQGNPPVILGAGRLAIQRSEEHKAEIPSIKRTPPSLICS